MRRWDAALVYLILSGGITLASQAMFVGLAVYYVTTVGLNPLQLVLVGTVLEATILIFELPTGVVADTYSRRMSVILGMFVLGAAWLLEGSIPLFAAILVAEFVRGIGETFLSGALDAWLADEVGEDRVGGVLIRASQVDRVMSLVGLAVGAALGSQQTNWPVLLGGALFLALGVFLLVFMPERGFTPAPHADRNPLRAMRGTLRDGVRVVQGHPLLVSFLLATATWGAASEGFDRLWEALLLTDIAFPLMGDFKPVVWLAVIAALTSLIGLAVTHLMQPYLEAASRTPSVAARLLALLMVLVMGATLALAVAGSFWSAVVALVARGVLLSLAGPLHQAWLIQNVPSAVRATVISMAGLSNAFGQTLGGPGVGALGNTRGLRAALAAAGVLLLPEIAVFAQAGRQGPAQVDEMPSEAIAEM